MGCDTCSTPTPTGAPKPSGGSDKMLADIDACLAENGQGNATRGLRVAVGGAEVVEINAYLAGQLKGRRDTVASADDRITDRGPQCDSTDCDNCETPCR